MKIILGSRKHHYAARISILLIIVALIGGMVGCGGGGGVTRYTLTMTVAGGNGTATDLTNASTYAAGAGVSIEAVAAAGYHFVSWTAPAGGFANATAAQTTFTMPAQSVTVTASFAEGQLVRTWYDLDDVRDDLDGHYILMNDLDSGTAGYMALASPTANGGKGWQPIGSLEIVGFDYEFVDPFTGTFGGQGYEIGDLFIDRPDEDGVGLFGAVDVGGVIENVGMVDADVTGNYGVGILEGASAGTVSSSYSSGRVSGSDAVGGLVGENVGSVNDSLSIASVNGSVWVGGLVGLNAGTVSNSSAYGAVTGYMEDAGGLVGLNDHGTVDSSYAFGSVTSDFEVGGLVGLNNGGTVSNSYATGSVDGSDAVGGLVGEIGYGNVDSSYATGDVDGSYYVGGLVGYSDGDVSNSYATGDVTGYDYGGGLVGWNYGNVSNSYSIGSVTGNSSVGGLVGWSEYTTVTNSFWDTETSGQATSDGGTGKNTTEMKDIGTFSGALWDITAVTNSSTRSPAYIWNIVDDVTYPFLSWQP